MVSPIVIAGPTGSGKSALALRWAKQLGGEIICADSRQVYSGMRIGTAGPSDAECEAVPHHGFGVIDPACDYDAGAFVHDATHWIKAIQNRQNLPMLVGGTGLYLRCLRYGLSDVPAQDPKVRAELEAKRSELGLAHLHAELERVDPMSAKTIHPNDAVRILRALEIFKITKTPASQLRSSHAVTIEDDKRYYLLVCPKDWLNERLWTRCKAMFEQGLVDETQQLLFKLPQDHPRLSTMGYFEAMQVLLGNMTLPSAIERTFIRQRQYAKRQMTWFLRETWWEHIDARDADGLLGPK